MKKEIAVIFVTTGIICAIFALNAKNSYDIVEVDTILVEKKTIINQIIASGNIEEKNKSYVSINQNGVVQTVNFSVGDSIAKGDEILTIKTTDLQLNQSGSSIIDLIENKSITILDTSSIGELKIISNVNGVITSIPSVANESIISGVPFLSICDEDNLVVRVSISEKNIKEAQVKQDVFITGESFDGTIFGEISQIMPYATASLDILNSTTTVEVEAIVELGVVPSDIIVGCSVEAKITIDEKKDALTIPFDVIYQENMQEYVYILEDNTISKREITTGYEVAERVEVLSGLQDGEIVVSTKGVFEGQVVLDEQ